MTNLNLYDLNKKQAHLYFTMKDGTLIKMRLFEDGYVSYDNWISRVVVKTEGKLFERIFEEATPENYVYETGK